MAVPGDDDEIHVEPERYEKPDDDLIARADDESGLNAPVRYSRKLRRILEPGEDFPPDELAPG